MKKGIFSLPRGVPFLLFTSMLMYMGFYALIPYVSYHLTHNLLMTPVLVGLVLSTRQLSQQGITFVTGMVADRLGYKWMMSFGMAIRGIGFALFGLVTTPAGLFAAAILAGFGGALFEPTRDAALSTLTAPEDRSRVYAIRKVLGNIGIALASLLGGVLVMFDFTWLSVVCGASYIFAALLTLSRLPNLQVQIKKVPYGEMWRVVLRDSHFLKFIGISIGYYFLYMQTYVTIPIQAVAITGSVQAISMMNLTLAAIIIFGQVPINRLMGKRPLLQAIQIGLVLMGGGLVVLGTASNLIVFVLGMAVFASGMMIIEPANFEFTSKQAKPELTATYFGFSSLAIAIGGSVSQSAGGYLLQAGQDIGHPWLIWWVSSAVALASIYGLARLRRGEKNRPVVKAAAS
jgi:DHA1 family multidrug resistance protein-like MFS transporter